MALKYTLFAGISMLGNLYTQHVVLSVLKTLGILDTIKTLSIPWILRDKAGLLVAIFFGTLVGLVIKYVLDKRYIFNFETKGKSENTKKFLMYSFMGVFTTLIYWAFELSFDLIFGFEAAKYIGAAIGLTIGYIIKYNLDKRFVFTHR